MSNNICLCKQPNWNAFTDRCMTCGGYYQKKITPVEVASSINIPPPEMQEQINNEALEYAKDEHGYDLPDKGYIEGATTWAMWKVRYDELKKLVTHYKEVATIENEHYRERCYEYSALKEKADKMKAALRDIAAGKLLPQLIAAQALAWKGGKEDEKK